MTTTTGPLPTVVQRQDQANVFVAECIQTLLHANGSIKLPVRRKAVSIQSRLIEIEMLLRRAAWPGMSDMDALEASERMRNRIDPEQWATPRSQMAWTLVLAVETLREMLRTPTPSGVASLSIEIGMGLMAVLAESVDFQKLLEQIHANVKPHAQARNAERGFDAAMKKRDHKQHKTPGAEAQYPKETIKEAVAEIKKRVKESKGKLTKTQAAKDVRKEKMLFKIDSDYLRRECYERNGVKPVAKGKPAHK